MNIDKWIVRNHLDDRTRDKDVSYRLTDTRYLGNADGDKKDLGYVRPYSYNYEHKITYYDTISNKMRDTTKYDNVPHEKYKSFQYGKVKQNDFIELWNKKKSDDEFSNAINKAMKNMDFKNNAEYQSWADDFERKYKK